VGDPENPENLRGSQFRFYKAPISLSETPTSTDTTMASLSDIAVETTSPAQEELTQEAIVKVLWAAVDLLRDLVGNV
jgi:hypothetical protein